MNRHLRTGFCMVAVGVGLIGGWAVLLAPVVAAVLSGSWWYLALYVVAVPAAAALIALYSAAFDWARSEGG